MYRKGFSIICHHNQVGMAPHRWLPYCGGKELLLWIVESEVSMTYDIVCSEAQSEKAIQHLGVLILLWRRHYHITQQELSSGRACYSPLY